MKKYHYYQQNVDSTSYLSFATITQMYISIFFSWKNEEIYMCQNYFFEMFMIQSNEFNGMHRWDLAFYQYFSFQKQKERIAVLDETWDIKDLLRTSFLLALQKVLGQYEFVSYHFKRGKSSRVSIAAMTRFDLAKGSHQIALSFSKFSLSSREVFTVM